MAKTNSVHNKLNYVFERFRLSTDGISWISDGCVKQSNECRDTPYMIAGSIASHYMQVTEQGVRVKFLGLQKDRDWQGPITPMNNFTLTLKRD